MSKSIPVRFAIHPLIGSLFLTVSCGSLGAAELAGRTVLPAGTFAPGPVSGQYLGPGPINGQPVPFTDQPVQGFSAVSKNPDGTFWVMADNGYGTLENSADFNLRVYRMAPRFRTADGGAGKPRVLEFVELQDPDRKIPFAITNAFSKRRVLTGADFDIESMQRAADGTLWFGDEFGPFLLHTDANGKVLEAPFALPDFSKPGQEIRSPQNPFSEEGAAVRVMNAFRSNGQQFGGRKTPVFSPYHVMLKYDATARYPASDPDLHYARGANTPADLAVATSDVFAIRSLQAAGFPVVTWTVNESSRMDELLDKGVNGIISDRPDLLLKSVRQFDADADGVPGDLLDEDGLPDVAKFDVQGHRGARDLRPENTLPAMEAALDHWVTTLETDTGVTRDREAVLSHDPYVEASKCRRSDGGTYTEANQVLIKDLTRAELQSTYICDKIIRDPNVQTNKRSLSPAAVAFARREGLPDPYAMPTVQQLYDFVEFYEGYYRSGVGKNHKDADARAATARKVRFNIETKINPRGDADPLGKVYKARTFGPTIMAKTLAEAVRTNGMTERTDIQSFDFRTLRYVQEHYPEIRPVFLFGDFPIIKDPARLSDSDDGTNLQDEGGANTPWLAGLYWPYRQTVQSNGFRAQRSGGFEGMALTTDGSKLLPLLELPLDAVGKDLLIHEFDLAKKRYTGVRHLYPLDAAGTNIGDFILYGEDRGLVIERDASTGDLKGFKRVFDVRLNGPNKAVTKSELVDLMKIDDPNDIARGQAGDIGLGRMFAMPFVTIEDIVVLDRNHIGIINDNNFPFSVGRHVGSGKPDDSEFIELLLDRPLSLD